MTFHQVVLRRFGVAVLALAALLSLGALSGAAAAKTRSAAAKTRSGTSESASGMARDQRIANDARLRLSDLPPGWMAGSSAAQPTAEAPCPSLRRAAGSISAAKVSPSFSIATGPTLAAQSETYVYADTALARHWFGRFSGPRTRSCLARILRAELATTVELPGIKIGPIGVGVLSIAPIGDQDSAFRVTVPVSGSGMSFNVDVDVVFVQAGRGLEIFTLGSVGSPFDPGLETSLVTAVTGRLDADLQR
jgi:hypothetical protein